MSGQIRARVLLVLLLASAILPVRSGAQTVVGTVLDQDSRAPVEGALVLLLDVSGRQSGGTLTNDQGGFLLRAPEPGAFTLRIERIGYRTLTSDVMEVGDSQPIQVTLEVVPVALELEGIVVEGAKRCVVRPEEGMLAADLWEEAGKVLRNQAWSEREGLFSFMVSQYQRELEPETGLVLSEDRQPEAWTTGNPIQSLPAPDLLAHGFIRQESDGYRYYGPDADVLLSDEFLNTHCFRVSERASQPRLIGLAFEPIERTALADITGTLWLNRSDARPRFLEFGYTESPWPEAKGVAAGRVDLEELPGGVWIVRRWRIRMPKMVRNEALTGGGRSGLRVAALVEAGGEVLRTIPRGAVTPSPGPTGTLTGVVRDSTGVSPLVGAEVYLSGTRFVATADAAGSFSMLEIPEGSYTATFRDPHLDSLGIYPPSVDLTVTEDRTTQITLTEPSLASVLAAICPGMEDEAGLSAVVGTVRTGRNRAPIGTATVTVEWTDYRRGGGGELLADVRTLQVTSDTRGRFRVCGVPPGVLLTARASFAGAEGSGRRSEIGRSQILVLDLILKLAPKPR